jgi:ribonucleoside-diphosphate reductase alpha chain
MRVVDPAWIGAKLRQLLDFPEPRGDFFAKDPTSEKSLSWPSTVAYVARLMIHRYAQLGILDEEGFPMEEMGVMEVVREEGHDVVKLDDYRGAEAVETTAETSRSVGAMEVQPGKACPECGNHAVVKQAGCDFCTACGHVGSCG